MSTSTTTSAVFELKITASPKLYSYLEIIAEKDNTIYVGNVVSHLDIHDWCELRGFRLLSFDRRAIAHSDETTTLTRKPLNSIYISKPTVMGIPTPAITGTAIKIIG